MSVANEVEVANAAYAASFTKGGLGLPPQRKLAIVACMDARLDPAKALGLQEGDAHVIRNAGGRAIDALRSIIISQQLLGTREVIVIHHTDCGMLTFTDATLRTKIHTDLHQNADHIAFLPFSDLKQSALDDVRIVRDSPFVLDVDVTGFYMRWRVGGLLGFDFLYIVAEPGTISGDYTIVLWRVCRP